MGNIYSIKNAFEKTGADVRVVYDSKLFREADSIVIPGVGAFDSAMKNLAPLKDDLLDAVRSGTPFMGICLGMQVLFEKARKERQKASVCWRGTLWNCQRPFFRPR